MAYTALQLINRAYYLSQVVARELQTVDGTQITDGLYLLNAILDLKASDLHLIPYFQQYNFVTSAGSVVNGSWVVTIPNLLFIDSMTFNIGTVRYSMSDLTRKQFFATPRVDDIQSLPFSYRAERVKGGMNVYLYFEPADSYSFRIWGKFGLSDVTLTTDLSLTYDGFYIEYLRYALADYICSEWGTTFPAKAQRQYDEIRKKLLMISPADLSITKRSFFNTNPAMDWQWVNIGKGWYPF